jgi:hypothetical protein
MKGHVEPDVEDDEDGIVDADDDLFDSITPSHTQLTAARQVHGTMEGSSSEEDEDEDE